MRILALIAAVVVIYWIVRTLARSKQVKRATTTPLHRDTVQCKYCGVHIPLDEAVGQGDHAYCSEEHQRLDHNKPD